MTQKTNKKRKPYKSREKLICFYLWRDSRLPIASLAEMLNVGVNSVNRWIAEWKKRKAEDNLGSLLDKSREDTIETVAYGMEYVKDKAAAKEFDDEFVALAPALKHYAQIGSIIAEDAPFTSQKGMLESLLRCFQLFPRLKGFSDEEKETARLVMEALVSLNLRGEGKR